MIVTSTIGCGTCSYCRAGCYAQCDVANPNGPSAGTAFFGGPKTTGPINGLQAEYARVPHAMTTLVRVPDRVSDDEATLLSDIFPTGWFAARLAEVSPGDTVAIFGAGAVGQFAPISAKRQGAGLIIVVDAQRPKTGPAADEAAANTEQFDAERRAAAPESGASGDRWQPGDAPSQVSQWAVEAVAKAGSIGVAGVYPAGFSSYPLGDAMNKNLTVRLGNCNHRRYLPGLLDLVVSGVVRPTDFITQTEVPDTAIDAYQTFDQRADGWLKTVLAVDD